MFGLDTKKEITMLRVLLVAPAIANIDNATEIRSITSLTSLRVSVLSGHVLRRTVYDAVQEDTYDIIHFAVHSNQDYLSLNGDKLPPSDIGQIARLAHAKLVFFNSCNSGRLASHLVQRDIEFAIFANIELPDRDAWTMPLAFYEFLDRQIRNDRTYSIPKAFNDAITGDGNYGITSSYDRVGMLSVQRQMWRMERAIIATAIAAGVGVLHFVGTIIYWMRGGG